MGINGRTYSGTLTKWAEKGAAMLKNEERQIAEEFIPKEPDDIVSDLLYTLFQTMDEYVDYFTKRGYVVDDLTKMKDYIDTVMRKYVKILYDVEVE